MQLMMLSLRTHALDEHLHDDRLHFSCLLISTICFFLAASVISVCPLIYLERATLTSLELANVAFDIDFI